MSKQHGERLLEMIEEGNVDRDMIIMCFVKWMADDDIANMMKANEIPPLLGYFVLYEMPGTLLGSMPLAMRFMADDVDHAEEQAADAEPEANILFVSLARSFEEAVNEYWNM